MKLDHSLKKHLESPVFKLVSETGQEEQVAVYVVGGWVRDLLLGRVSKDVDIVVVGSGVAFAQKVAEKVKGTTSLKVFGQFGTAMIRYGGYDIEFVGARRESYHHDSRKPVVENGTLEEDISRRDFTINAMAVSLNVADYGLLIDRYDGVKDLRDGLIRTPLDPGVTYSDDPLRMMRAIRFATQLGFQIENDSYSAIKRHANRLGIVSVERVMDEFNKIMMASQPGVGLKLLFDTGLLQVFFPELAMLVGVEVKQGKAHKDNFLHTIQVLDKLANKSDNLWLRWAALLHDIAKPQTKRFEPEVGWTFHGHEFIGSKMIGPMFRRLRLPTNEKMKYVRKLVLLHLRPIALTESIVTDSAVRRLLFDAGDDIDDLMLLCEADITSGNPAKVKKFLENFERVRIKLQEIEEKDRIRNWQPPVSGEDIMVCFGLQPGREVGLIKNAIREAILEGDIPNERQAALVKMVEEGKKIGLTVKREII